VLLTHVHTQGETVMLIQRDKGERLNRKHARLKYTVEDMGLDAFRAEFIKRRCVVACAHACVVVIVRVRTQWHQARGGASVHVCEQQRSVRVE
jgi:sulfite reductase beta subunit-like hemoprotein